MENSESLFSGFFDTLKANIVPIIVVLILLLVIIGWLVYKSFIYVSKDDQDPESKVEEFDSEDTPEENNEQTETSKDDENTSSE
jgi:hypothetical protein